MIRDAWRLAVGTLTALPVRPPVEVDRRRAGLAMLLAPLAALPLGLVAAAIVVVGDRLDLPPVVTALLALGAVVLGNRAFHLDGLSDVVDGMAASYDRERSLAVMKSGTSGPAGVVATVLVVGLQAASTAALLRPGRVEGDLDAGWFAYTPLTDPAGIWSRGSIGAVAVLVGLSVCVSRLALAACCLRGLRAARPDGLGRLYTETVPRWLAAGCWLAGAAALAAAASWAGLDWWRGLLAAGLALTVVGVLVARALTRLGGVTGDVFGAAVELALATILVVLA